MHLLVMRMLLVPPAVLIVKGNTPCIHQLPAVLVCVLVLNPIINRDGESSLAYAPKASSPTGASPTHTTTAAAPPPAPASPPASALPPASAHSTAQHTNNEVDGFDEFDPRGSFSGKEISIIGTSVYFLSPSGCWTFLFD